MTSQKEHAYAKMNLYLDIEGIRDDGFHSIVTVMHTVSLCDDITVSVAPSRGVGVSMQIEGSHRLPTDGKNLAARAAMLYLERIGEHACVKIKLRKRIPIAAGLAGGSSDAAAVLRAMNRIYKRALSERALLSLAAELGSDVPYCVKGKTALCRGRGEDMTPLCSSLSLHTVIAVADEHISTPWAYRELDRIYSSFDGSVPHGKQNTDSLISDIARGALSPSELYNIFEDAILPSCGGASDIKAKLLERGAYAALMSGSGPSVFGLFADEHSARECAAYLSGLGYTAHYARSV